MLKYNAMVQQLLENFAQDVATAHVAINRQLMHNIKKNPALLMQLIARSPGMHADLLMGRMDALAQKFQHMGVNVQQISNQIAQARDLLTKQQAGAHVPVKKALPVNANANEQKI